jgi:hypothetical protein
MAFFFGAPRVFGTKDRHAGGNERVLQLEFDRTQKYLAVLTRSTLSIWSGKVDLALLAHHKRDDVREDQQEGNVELVWNPGSTEIAVLAADGGIVYYSLIKQTPSYSLPLLLDNPTEAEVVSLQPRQRAWADHHFLASATRDGRAIVCGTSDGQIVRISWAGSVTTLLALTNGAKYTVVAGSDGGGAGGSGYHTASVQPSPQAPVHSSSEAVRPADTQLSASDINEIQRQVREFYEVHNPVKLSTSPADFVQTTVEKWRGKEHLLLSSLHRKYGVPTTCCEAEGVDVQVSKLSMTEIERSQPATIVRIRVCSKLGVCACVRQDGGLFLAPHSPDAPGDALSTETTRTTSNYGLPSYEGVGGNHPKHCVAVRTWVSSGGGVRGAGERGSKTATCVAWGRVYSATDAVVSVGYTDGTVACLLVKMPEHSGSGGGGEGSAGAIVSVSSMRYLDLSSAGFATGFLSVENMCWDRSGECLACLYSNSQRRTGAGCVLWSAFGGVTSSTLPGVRACVCWGVPEMQR